MKTTTKRQLLIKRTIKNIQIIHTLHDVQCIYNTVTTSRLDQRRPTAGSNPQSNSLQRNVTGTQYAVNVSFLTVNKTVL